jgi:hypothetical protein
MTTWTKPSVREIQMNAEIGSYQADDGGVDRVARAGRTATSADAGPPQGEAAGMAIALPDA